MRYLWLLLLLFVTSPEMSLAGRLEDILSYRSIGQLQLSPAANQLAFVVTTQDLEANTVNSDVWVISLPDGEPRQLTRYVGEDQKPQWSPDGQRLVFLSDRTGRTGPWVMSANGGEPTAPISFEGDVLAVEWLPDGNGFVFAARPARDDPGLGVVVADAQLDRASLYIFELGDREPTRLTEDAYHVNSFDVASIAGDTVVIFGSQPSPRVLDERLYSDLKRVSLTTGKVEALVEQPGLDRTPFVSPGGSRVAFISMAGRFDWLSNYYIYSVEMNGNGPAALFNLSEAYDERISYHTPGNEQVLCWSPDEKQIYYLGQDGPDHRLWELEVEGGATAPVGDFDEGGSVASFARSTSGDLYVSFSTPNRPGELYRLSKTTGEMRALTSVNAGYPLDGVGSTDLVVYPSFDGRESTGYVVRPPDFDPARRYPLLTIVHGGPMGVFGSGFAPRRGAYPVHAFAEAGYLVFMPNPRGSGGFGEAARKAVVGDWGGGDLKDILYGLDYLIEQGSVDADRLGIMGWSYGGFMTAWTITQTDRFKAASIGAAITNPYSFYGVTDIPAFIEAYFGGPPWDAQTDYLGRAAENRVERVTTPSLLQHGEEDERVPLSQSRSFYRALRKVGVETELVIYPRTPHGLSEPRLILDAMRRNLEWFERWVSHSVSPE